MTLLDSEGFGLSNSVTDFYTYGAWQLAGGSGSGGSGDALGTGGPSGDNYYELQSSHWLYRVLPQSAITNIIFGVRCNILSNGAYGGVALMDSAGGNQLFINLNGTNGQISVYSGVGNMRADANFSGGTLLGQTGTGAFTAGAWSFLEVQAVIATAGGGSVTVRVAGATVLTLTAVTTQVTANAGVGQIELKGPGYGNASHNGHTHLYVCDNTGAAPWNGFLGDVRVQTLLPTANGTVTFTPNGAATNWQNAAEYPPVPGTDFNQSSAVGNQDTFAHGAMETNNGLVFGVNVKSILLDGGVSTTMTDVLVSGASTLDGPTVTPGTAALQYPAASQTDPSVSGQWQAAAVNAATFGYKRLT